MSGVLAAMAAGLAVWLLVPGGGDVSRLATAHPRRLPAWLRPVPGALPLRTRALGGVAVGIGLWIVGGGGFVAAAIGGVLGVGVSLGLGRLAGRGAARRKEQLLADLPQALDLLVACLEAGLPLRAAAAAAGQVFDGPLAEEMQAVSSRLAVGTAEAQAWRDVHDDGPWGRVARDVARSVGSGTSLGPTLRRHADDVRAEHAAAVQARAKAVGVRSVMPLMVCFLPAFLLVGVVPIVAGVVLRLLA